MTRTLWALFAFAHAMEREFYGDEPPPWRCQNCENPLCPGPDEDGECLVLTAGDDPTT